MAIGSPGDLASSLSVTELLAPFLADPDGTGVFSDFDGTLAPIVDDPATAVPLDGVVDALGDLARRYGRVGVISGRPASFLQTHLGGRGLFLSGLYGLEFVEGGTVRHYSQPELNFAVRNSGWVPSGDSRKIDRKGAADISPLTAAALAFQALSIAPAPAGVPRRVR